MAAETPYPQLTAILHEQHLYYTAELARTHLELSKLYRKLARTERSIANSNSGEWEISRREKKHLIWSRSLSRRNIEAQESQQAMLHDYIRQCNNLLAAFEDAQRYDSSICSSITPWTARGGHMPPSPYPHTPIAPQTPWSRYCFGEQAFQQQWPRPQYWDLSMLRERRTSSHGPSTADSGFREHAMYAQPFHWTGEERNINHVFAHEYTDLSNPPNSGRGMQIVDKTARPGSAATFGSNRDGVPEMHVSSPLAPRFVVAGGKGERPATTGSGEVPAAVKHKRRYSEAAISLIESRLAASPKTRYGYHKRGLSLGTGAAAAAAAALKRTSTEGSERKGSVGSAALT